MSKNAQNTTAPPPVAENFKAELASIVEKGKDLKGEKRENYQSIVQRIENNNQVLSDLREEHTQLREKLTDLVREKNSRSHETNLDSAIKHANHDVNLLKKRIDKLKHEKEQSLKSQKEAEVILANFKNAETTEHPEEARIQDMKNRLDKANIKNSETTHLQKIYAQIIHILDKQKTRYTPIIQKKQAENARKQKDIDELTLISRDSKHSYSIAVSEYNNAEVQINAARQKRDKLLSTKKEQAKLNNMRQMVEVDLDQKASKPQPSLNSQPSVLRNKLNKAAREKREEKYRETSSVYEQIRDRFGTNDPEKIKAFFDERRETTQTLEKQIHDLKVAIEALEKKSSQLKSALEESEYASAKGVGGNRLLTEGKKILEAKKEELHENRKKMSAQEAHQRQIKAAAHHLLEVMALVRNPSESTDMNQSGVPQAPQDEVSVESSTKDILRWCREKCHSIKALNDEEDQDYVSLVNKREFVNIIQRTESNFDMEQVQSDQIHRIRPLDLQHKRQPKENKGDVQTRVLDRQQVKMQAQKALQMSLQKQKKPNQ
ncbi:hypothetical protein M9Y10_022780 [Tritrichomonas musculus]|uniref:Uncharacterized protein n=1 Tax=Tritrichomonas musculus TaxID=1915356 RepID=A0ABR2KTA3_9EUKA